MPEQQMIVFDTTKGMEWVLDEEAHINEMSLVVHSL